MKNKVGLVLIHF